MLKSKSSFKDGKNGMGQAQSQSMGGDCSDCYGNINDYFILKNWI